MATTTTLLRVDRLVSSLGLCTRREANNFIRQKVTVDGVPLPSQSLRVDPRRLLIDGVSIAFLCAFFPFFFFFLFPQVPASTLAVPLVVALHKPAGYVCSRVADGAGKKTVYDLLPIEWSR